MAAVKKQIVLDPEEAAYLDEKTKKALSDRLARIEGHVRSIRAMIHDERCADEILLQVTAVKAALNQFSASLLDRELKCCMTTCMTGDANERLDKVTRVLSAMLKQT